MLGLRFEECNTMLLSFSFEKCILDMSSFFRLRLKGTHFDNCSLHEVDFAETDLSRCSFANADMQGAIFDNTILEGADLSAAFNFQMDPDANYLKKARFSSNNLGGLLTKYGIIIN
jgi:fluoroquinolone resistance protein